MTCGSIFTSSSSSFGRFKLAEASFCFCAAFLVTAPSCEARSLRRALQPSMDNSTFVADNSTFLADNSTFVAENNTFVLDNSTYIPENSTFFPENSTELVEKREGRSEETERLEELCISTGGQVGTAQCCLGASPFPSQILLGPCGCSPQNSAETVVCECPDDVDDLAFDTTWGCIPRGAYLDCQRADGMVYTDECCESTEDFPDTCDTLSVGQCGCSPENSRPVLKCQCPEDLCWDGTDCI